jgi:glycosyltransferase involved in cell wall biosynthesis
VVRPEVKILHVVTLLSADGAFGGPGIVALDLARSQASRGHEVVIAGLARVSSGRQLQPPNVGAALFRPLLLSRRLGFAGMTNPLLAVWLWRHVPSFDVVHVHLARDLVTLPAAEITLRRGGFLALQTHGMVDAPLNSLARAADRVSVARVLRSANVVLGLLPEERVEVESVARTPVSFVAVGNGIALPPSGGGTPDGPILLVGRLHPRKRPLAFVEAASLVAAARPGARFLIVGPDEGELEQLLALRARLGLEDAIEVLGARTRPVVEELMRSASVLVLPAENEPFGLVLIEAMALGVPVICTSSCGLATAVAESGAGLVTDGSPRELADAMLEVLGHPTRWGVMGASARHLVETHYSLAEVVNRVEDAYVRTGWTRPQE